jgi:hypothetical protein
MELKQIGNLMLSGTKVGWLVDMHFFVISLWSFRTVLNHVIQMSEFPYFWCRALVAKKAATIPRNGPQICLHVHAMSHIASIAPSSKSTRIKAAQLAIRHVFQCHVIQSIPPPARINASSLSGRAIAELDYPSLFANFHIHSALIQNSGQQNNE